MQHVVEGVAGGEMPQFSREHALVGPVEVAVLRGVLVGEVELELGVADLVEGPEGGHVPHAGEAGPAGVAGLLKGGVVLDHGRPRRSGA